MNWLEDNAGTIIMVIFALFAVCFLSLYFSPGNQEKREAMASCAKNIAMDYCEENGLMFYDITTDYATFSCVPDKRRLTEERKFYFLRGEIEECMKK